MRRTRSSRSKRNRRGLYRFRPTLEPLEQRWLLSATPTGNELLVNEITAKVQETGEQSQAVGVQPSGGFVVTFSGHGVGDSSGVYFDRFDANGARIGSQVRANTTTSGDQFDSSVGVAGDGSFVIVWTGRGAGDQHGVFFQRYSANGTPIGGETLVNSTTAGPQEQPAIAMAPDGSFAVVWSGAGNGDDEGIFMQVYNADGSKRGGEVRVNVAKSPTQTDPTAAFDGEQIVVAWSSRHQDGSDHGVYARRFSSDGAALSGEFRVNTTTARSQVYPSVAINSNDEFIIAWSSRGQDGGGFGVYAQRYDADGTKLGGEFQVNSTVALNQVFVQVSAGADGYFFTWMSAMQDGSGWGVIGRHFDSQGNPVADEFVVNTTTVAAQRNPSVAQNDSGNLVFAWSGVGNGDRLGVFSRVFTTDAADVNQPPDLEPFEDREATVGEEITLTAVATDPNAGDTLTFSLDEDAPEGATIDPLTGQFSWTPDADQVGEFTITIIVTDNGEPPLADQETFTITVSPAENSPPNLQPIEDRNATVGQELTLSAMATDPDNDDLTYLLGEGAPEGATIDPETGEFSWTPGAAQTGEFTITIIVTDDGESPLADQEVFTVTVSEVGNDAPDLEPIEDREATVGEELTLTAVATDPDDDDLTYLLDEDAPEGATIDPETGEFSWTPEADQVGEFTITVIVTDDGEPPLADRESFTVAVSPVENLAPDLDPIDDRATTAGAAVNFTAEASDPNSGDTLTFLLDEDAPEGASIDPETGAFSWTPTAEQVGEFTITVIVTDSGESPLADQETFTITVGANNPPELQSFEEETADVGVEVNLTAMATDPDGNLFTFALENAPDGATIDPETGEFSWTPTADQTGTFQITVRVTDNGLAPLDDEEILTIVVNQGPTANDDEEETDEDVEMEFDVLENDTDAEGAIDPTTVTIVDMPEHGSVDVDDETGVVTYTPVSDFSGTDTFTYTVRDERGALSNLATVTVTINPVNDDPTAVEDGFDDIIANSDENSLDVLANDSAFPDDDEDETLTIVSVGPTNMGGTAVVAPGGLSILYTPDEDFLGEERFTYTISDGNGGTDTAEVIVTVISENQPPEAQDIVRFIDLDEQTTFDVVSLASDPDGTVDPTSVEIVLEPSFGDYEVNATTGVITYMPTTETQQIDFLQYTVRDNLGAVSEVATISIVIGGVNPGGGGGGGDGDAEPESSAMMIASDEPAEDETEPEVLSFQQSTTPVTTTPEEEENVDAAINSLVDSLDRFSSGEPANGTGDDWVEDAVDEALELLS